MEGFAVREQAGGAGASRLKRLARAAALLIAAGIWILAATRLWRTTVPGDLRVPQLNAHDFFTHGQLAEATSFERFLAVDGLLSTLATLVALALYARGYRRFTAESAAGRIGTGLLLGMLAFAFVWLVQLPFGLAAVGWERSHGVSKQGYLEWAFESWFSLAGQFLFICAAIAIVMALARPLRRTWWLAGAPVFTGLALLFAFLSPYLIPDLGKLHRHDLRVAASHLSKVEGVQDVTVSVEEVHQFTTAPNAEATGIGSTKRVILWDTLIREPFTTREIRQVIAHELAHLKRAHILKGVGLYGLFAFPLAFAIAVATRRRGGMFEPGSVPLAILVLTLLSVLTTPLQNAFVRRYETEADWVGLSATKDPAAQISTMKLLAITSKSRPDPPALEHLYEDGHPTILERIALTKAWEERRTERRRKASYPRTQG